MKPIVIAFIVASQFASSVLADCCYVTYENRLLTNSCTHYGPGIIIKPPFPLPLCCSAKAHGDCGMHPTFPKYYYETLPFAGGTQQCHNGQGVYACSDPRED